MKKTLLYISTIAILILLPTILWGLNEEKIENAVVIAEKDGITYPSRVSGQAFEVYQDSEWQLFTIKGVNMGMAKPGTFPGEAAITREEYDRWFQAIGEMNANAIQIGRAHV